MPNLKPFLPFHHLNTLRLNLHHMRMPWSLLNLLDQLLDTRIIALSFALDFLVRRVADPACEVILACGFLGEPAEVDSWGLVSVLLCRSCYVMG